MRVYLHAAPKVYLIERHSTFGPAVTRWLSANATALVSSELARLESLIVPVRVSDAVRIRNFEFLFSVTLDELLPLDRVVFDLAVLIRAAHSFKTPDAVHLANATESGCDVFLTNDHRLTKSPDIRVELI